VGALRVAAGAGGGRRVAGAVPIGTPLPHVARHVVQAVAVGREGGDRGETAEAVLAAVLEGERALPDVGHPAAAGPELVAPVVRFAVQAAAGGALPLRLGRQALAGPPGV